MCLLIGFIGNYGFETITEPKDSAALFACPVCFEPLIRKGPPGFNLPAIYRSGFKCVKCNKSYSSKNMYLDLTLIAGAKEYVEAQPSRTELFRSPLVSFLYERGWRQNFNLTGFPGPDEEFKMAQEYFKPAEGGILVDVSCGSGLFSRKFAKAGTYSKVIALDFSENMLRQTYDFIKADDTILSSNLALVRADVSRLPFPSGSIDAVHAGAALHCWPSPSNAVCYLLPFRLNFIIFCKMPFPSLRFVQFCEFRPKVCFTASGSKRFEILSFSSGSLTLSIFLG
ncbi:putative demethylmenaquinone methyltransferase transcription factor C2H2 family [Helianthus debilis subsp. tardiflorus]